MAIDATNNAKPQYGEDWVSSLVAIDPSTGAVKAMVSGQDYDVEPDQHRHLARRSPDRLHVQGDHARRRAHERLLAERHGRWHRAHARCRASSPGCRPSNIRTTRPTAPRTATTRWTTSPPHSINCAFVRLATSVGYDKVIATAHTMGITKDNIDVPILSETLGTYGQNTADHGGGDGDDRQPRRAPHAAHRGEGRRRRRQDRHRRDQQPRRAGAHDRRRRLRGESADPRRHRRHRWQRRGGRPGDLRQDRHHRRPSDAWFIGANPGGAGLQLATAVWFGNCTGRIAGAGFGGDSAAPVFADFMSKALAGQTAAAMPDPGPVCARPGGSR